MASKRKRGRPETGLPPRIDATPEQLAQAMFRLPANHQWEYLEDEPRYQCVQCERVVVYPEVLPDSGVCLDCERME